MLSCLYSAVEKAIRKFYSSVTEDYLKAFTFIFSFLLQISKERSIDVSNYLLLVYLKHDFQQAQWCICKYFLTCLFRLYSTKTENLAKRFYFQIWVTSPKNMYTQQKPLTCNPQYCPLWKRHHTKIDVPTHFGALQMLGYVTCKRKIYYLREWNPLNGLNYGESTEQLGSP